MADFIPSAQQNAFFDWVDTGTGSATMIAVAGAGKTTTILRGISRMKGRVFLGMFNKSIAKEAREKAEDMGIMRPGFKIGTMHSAGFSAWRYLNPSVQVDENKVKNITKRLMAREPRVERAMTFISKVVSFAKQLLIMQHRQGGPREGRGYGNHASRVQDRHDALRRFFRVALSQSLGSSR